MKALRRILSLVLCALLLLGVPVMASAAEPAPFALTVQVPGREDSRVRALWDGYAGNLYLSLSDLSRALAGSAKEFVLEYGYSSADGEYFTLHTGRSAAAQDSTGPDPTEKRAVADLWLSRNRLFVDESERKYYSYRPAWRDLYLSLTDIQLMLDMSARRLGEDCVELLPDEPFTADLKELDESGYFDAMDAYAVGDADTGKLLYVRNASRTLPVASLSKLMSYLLIAEALEEGRIALADTVTVSAAAEALSQTADGLVEMHAGQKVPLSELITAMLLASSNEAALALAEYTAGSETEFVEQMNQKAKELGYRSALFRSPHGLPVYSDSAVTAKLQNMMSASELFQLCRLLLDDYPQITGITGRKFCKLDELNYKSANSNPLVFNMEGVNGLKTGSTNRAGFCLAASMPVTHEGETHNIVLILLGAESAPLRGQAAEILLRSARSYYEKNGF